MKLLSAEVTCRGLSSFELVLMLDTNSINPNACVKGRASYELFLRT
jgi:hypothetical protein